MSLILAGEIVTESLGGSEGGEFAAWLHKTVGSFRLRDRSVPHALSSLGVQVVTTNYDGLIAEAAGYDRVTWRQGASASSA